MISRILLIRNGQHMFFLYIYWTSKYIILLHLCISAFRSFAIQIHVKVSGNVLNNSRIFWMLHVSFSAHLTQGYTCIIITMSGSLPDVNICMSMYCSFFFLQQIECFIICFAWNKDVTYRLESRILLLYPKFSLLKGLGSNHKSTSGYTNAPMYLIVMI